MKHKRPQEYNVTVTELRQQLTYVRSRLKNHTVAVLSHGKPAFYCISPEKYEQMLKALERQS